MDVTREREGYSIFAPDGSSIYVQSRTEAREELLGRGLHIRDVVELLDAADRWHEDGSTDVQMRFAEIHRAAHAGRITEPEMAALKSELENPQSPVEKAYLVGVFGLVERSMELERYVRDFMSRTQDRHAFHSALEVLLSWQSDSFVEAALECLREPASPNNEERRLGALAMVGTRVRSLPSRELLDELVRISSSAVESRSAHNGARVAIASAAGLDFAGAALFPIDDPIQVKEITRRAYGRFGDD